MLYISREECNLIKHKRIRAVVFSWPEKSECVGKVAGDGNFIMKNFLKVLENVGNCS